jgi:hypothetical protein
MNPEATAKEVCQRLSELEGKETSLTQQVVSGRIEVEGVYARFVDWQAALDHLAEMLQAAELHYAGRWPQRKSGWDKPKPTRKS